MAVEADSSKRPRMEQPDMMTSIRELLNSQQQQLEQAISTQLEGDQGGNRRD